MKRIPYAIAIAVIAPLSLSACGLAGAPKPAMTHISYTPGGPIEALFEKDYKVFDAEGEAPGGLKFKVHAEGVDATSSMAIAAAAMAKQAEANAALVDKLIQVLGPLLSGGAGGIGGLALPSAPSRARPR